MSDFVRPHRRQPTRLPRSWDSPGKNTGVGWIKELYKKDLHDPDNHDGVITDLEPDILRVWWTLGSITMNKASRGDGIPAVLFQILKDDALKVLHSICQQIWKNQQWSRDWKRLVCIPVPKKGNAKECSTATAAAKWLQSCPTLCDPETAAHQAPPSLGLSRREHWSGLPFPSPMHESEK